MKKLFALIITAALLAACSNEEKTEPEENPAPAEQPAGDEVTEGLKADTPEYSYQEFADNEVAANARVKFTGVVTAVEGSRFEVKSGADSPADEIIWVDDIRLGERTKIAKDTEVAVYGKYNGKDEEGVPVIMGIFIDAE